jgi:16S rRNA (cytosine967-C5)-methyltransferase
LPKAVQLLAEADVTKIRAWREGHIEVQDLGSQLILESIGIAPGGHWLDACAGAGGKTLQLAQLLGPAGLVDAHDVRPAALEELQIRAARAGLCHPMEDKGKFSAGDSSEPRHVIRDIARNRVTVIPAAPTGLYDGVLVDAPCSGTGTWRRSPHLKWTTGAGQITQAAEKQVGLLKEFRGRVRPGGRLVYATCSLSHFENEAVVTAFLREHPEFAPAPFPTTFGFTPRENGLTLLPARHNTDGFFVASLRRK